MNSSTKPRFRRHRLLSVFLVMLLSLSPMGCAELNQVVSDIGTGLTGQCAGASIVGAGAGGVGGYIVGQAVSDDAKVRAALTAAGALVGLYTFGRACTSALEQEAALEQQFAAVQAQVPPSSEGTPAAPAVEIVQVEETTTDEAGNEASSSTLMTKIEFGNDVLAFQSASATLSSNAELYLAPLAETLQTGAGQQLIIVGHTDTVGPADENLALSERRAASVADFLKAQGVEETRIQVIGAGEYKPAVEEERTEEDRARNRRVEVFVVHHVSGSA